MDEERERERSAGRQYLQSESIKAIFIVSFPYYPNVQVSLSPLLNFTAITNQNPHFSFAGIHGCYFFNALSLPGCICRHFRGRSKSDLVYNSKNISTLLQD